MSHSAHRETLEPSTMNELQAAIHENRDALRALAAEFAHWRKEPRLRTMIDIMQSELDAHRQTIERLAAQVRELREERLKGHNKVGTST